MKLTTRMSRKTEEMHRLAHPETLGAQQEEEAIWHVQLRAVSQWDVLPGQDFRGLRNMSRT